MKIPKHLYLAFILILILASCGSDKIKLENLDKETVLYDDLPDEVQVIFYNKVIHPDVDELDPCQCTQLEDTCRVAFINKKGLLKKSEVEIQYQNKTYTLKETGQRLFVIDKGYVYYADGEEINLTNYENSKYLKVDISDKSHLK